METVKTSLSRSKLRNNERYFLLSSSKSWESDAQFGFYHLPMVEKYLTSRKQVVSNKMEQNVVHATYRGYSVFNTSHTGVHNDFNPLPALKQDNEYSERTLGTVATTEVSSSSQENFYEQKKINTLPNSSAYGLTNLFSCDICHKRFTQSANLKTHKLVHIGIKPFPCNQCDKTYMHKGTLKMHKLTHVVKKPFQCEICGKSFTQGSSLRTHKLRHGGVKEFQCDICGKEFVQRNTLNRHKLVHGGEKPFECDVCGKTFNQKSNLNTHKLSHSNVKGK